MNRVPSPNSVRENPRAGDAPVREPVRSFESLGLVRPVDDGGERLRTGNANIDPFDIPDVARLFAPIGWKQPYPPGYTGEGEFSIEFKRWETYGRQDYAEQRTYQDQKWQVVTHEMVPPGRFAPPGTTGPVFVKDMVLMVRPMRLTLEARREEMTAATRAMEVHRRTMATAPDGQAPRMEPVLKSSREAIEIPD